MLTSETDAAVVAGWIAAAAAVASSAVSVIVTRAQLAHDRKERARERAMTLRRDVYLPAVEAISRLQGVLGKVTNLESSSGEIAQQFLDALAALAKVHLIAGMDTVRPVMQFVNVFLAAYLKLSIERTDLATKKYAFDVERTQGDRAAAEIDALIQQMKHFNLAGNQGQPLWGRLSDSLRRAQEALQGHGERGAALYRELQAKQLAVLERIARLSATVSTHIPDALLAARADLDLPIDAAEYRELFNEQQRVSLEITRQYADGVRRAGSPPTE